MNPLHITPLPLFIRNTLEQLRKLAGNYAPAKDDDAVRVIDIGSLPITKRKESRPYQRDPAKIDTIVVHVSGVRGGFGVSKRQLQLADAALKAGKHPDIERQLNEAGVLFGWEERARFLALMQRYRDTPYHVIGHRNGWVIRNRDPGRRTSHAGPGGNDGLGVCLMDCSPGERLDGLATRTAIKALAIGVDVLDDTRSLDDFDMYRVIAHRQVDHPRRRGEDPGRFMWRKVVREAERLKLDGCIYLDEQYTWGPGLPVEW